MILAVTISATILAGFCLGSIVARFFDRRAVVRVHEFYRVGGFWLYVPGKPFEHVDIHLPETDR